MKSRLVVLGAAVFAAHASAQDLSPEFEFAMERDLGISKADVPRFVNAENTAARIEDVAVDQLGESFAGSWMELSANGQFRYVVATTDGSQKLVSAEADRKVVQYSLKELDAALAALDKTLDQLYNGELDQGLTRAFPASSIRYMYVDVQTNSVVVKVAKDRVDAAIDFVAVSRADAGIVRIESTDGEPTPLVTTWGGREYQSGGGLCSIGFPTRRNSDNRRGFVTAGHCGGAGTTVRVGGATVGSVQGASFPGDDLAWATQRNSDSQIPFVTRYNGGSVRDVRVRGDSVGSIGASVCRSGRTTGYRCGFIVSRNVTVNYGNGPTRGLTQATACAGRGDSGGSWITPGGQAQGVTSGGQLTNGNDNCSASSPVTWFQPVREILSRYNLRLVR